MNEICQIAKKMSIKSQIASLVDKINKGKPTSLIIDAMAANISEYTKEPTFFDLPFDVISLVLSKVTSVIVFSTATNILSKSAQKYGKQAISFLQYIDCGNIGYEYACNLVKCLEDCPIIRELVQKDKISNPIPRMSTANIPLPSNRSRRNSLTPTVPVIKRESESTVPSEEINALKRSNISVLSELDNFIDKIETHSPASPHKSAKGIRRVTSDSLIIHKGPSTDDLTDIFQAIMENNYTLVKSIIQKDRSETNHRNNDNNYPLHIAAKYGHLKICELLVQSGADINQKGYSFLTPIHYAADFDFPEVLNYFINKGANIEAKSGWGDTPLHKASEQGNAECVRLLLAAGVNPNAKNLKGETAFGISKDPTIQQMLLQNGAKK